MILRDIWVTLKKLRDPFNMNRQTMLLSKTIKHYGLECDYPKTKRKITVIITRKNAKEKATETHRNKDRDIETNLRSFGFLYYHSLKTTTIYNPSLPKRHWNILLTVFAFSFLDNSLQPLPSVD